MTELFVLGAQDPEMSRIIALLKHEKKNFIYAKKDGERVNPGNAYEANNGNEIPDNVEIVFIECEIASIKPKFRIDHHRSGDPGYDKGPERYWEAASLGQLHIYLDAVITEQDKIIAAMDHCFNAAIKGLCHGISPESVLQVKLEEIAKALGCSTNKVKKEVNRFQKILRNSKTISMGSQAVYDINENVGIVYSLQQLSAQVAAVLSRVAVILHFFDRDGGPEKFHLCGDVSEQTVVYFMKSWAPDNGLTKIYGTPARGYAGGYKR